MSKTTRNILIIAGVAAVGLLSFAYYKYKRRDVIVAPQSAPGTSIFTVPEIKLPTTTLPPTVVGIKLPGGTTYPIGRM